MEHLGNRLGEDIVFDGSGQRFFLDEDQDDGGDHRERDHPDEDGGQGVVVGGEVSSLISAGRG
jgi:hypothetical protein